MAAAGNGCIRLRLHFDYPPPAAVGCRMCWLLVDVKACRVVADLESVIRDRFGFSRSSVFSLFIQDSYLPHTESIYVVRDSDDVRVKVDCLAEVNGHSSRPEKTREKSRKRHRVAEEEEEKGGPGCQGGEVRCKKKKKKKKAAHEDVVVPAGDTRRRTSAGGGSTQKKKKEKKVEDSCSTTKTSASPQKTPVRVELAVKPKKKPPAASVKKQNPPSSGTGSSEEDNVPSKTTSRSCSSTPAAPRTPSSTKPTHKPSSSSSSSSSDTETSSDDVHRTNPPPPTSTDSAVQSPGLVQNPAGSTTSPEDEIQLVIRRPQPPSWSLAGRGSQRGRYNRGGPGSGQRGRSETSRTIPGPDGPRASCRNESSYHTDSLTNKSVVLQNGAEPGQKQDYSTMPLLAAPPQVGQKIAFKLLELTENYTPEVSEYKEGKIMNFDPTTRQMELELLHASQAPAEPGKFDLVYQNPDGSEQVEYAVTRGTRVTERWESLLEPRLVI